jgi:hypothetical protein
MTTTVLEIELVDLVCIGSLHLHYVIYIYILTDSPPSPRPRASPAHMDLCILDQHGISLNTLSARCEPQGSTTAHPRGTLIITKDAGGVWCVD